MVSKKRYRERKRAVYVAVAGLQGSSNIECVDCGAVWESFENDSTEIHVDHVNPGEGHPEVSGGMNHLYLLEDDLKNSVELELRCKSCHEERHDRQLFSE